MLLVAFFIYISFRKFPKVATSKSKSNIWKELKGGKSKGVKKGLKALQKKKKKKQGLEDVWHLEPPTATATAPAAAASAVDNSAVAAEMLLLPGAGGSAEVLYLL